MSKTDAPESTPPATSGDKSSDEQLFYQRSVFMVTVMTMTWQLAIAVVVPIVAGYYLDAHFDTSPWLLLTGMAVALLGFVGVLAATVKTANKRFETKKPLSGGDKSE